MMSIKIHVYKELSISDSKSWKKRKTITETFRENTDTINYMNNIIQTYNFCTFLQCFQIFRIASSNTMREEKIYQMTLTNDYFL